MHSFTTQSHKRNHQGNVILHNANNPINHQTQRHKILDIIATSIMILAIAVTGSLLGVMTIHNQQLKHQVQTLKTQTNTINEEHCNDTLPYSANYIVTQVRPTQDDITKNNNESTPKHHQQHHDKTLKRIPISNQQHDTETLPSINNRNTDN